MPEAPYGRVTFIGGDQERSNQVVSRHPCSVYLINYEDGDGLYIVGLGGLKVPRAGVWVLVDSTSYLSELDVIISASKMVKKLIVAWSTVHNYMVHYKCFEDI